MALSIFDDKAVMPNDEMVAAALSDSKALWDGLKDYVSAACDMGEQWKFYSKKAGWSLVVKSGDRTILYLIPQENCFKANFVLGEKAVAAAQASDLPEWAIDLILGAKPYMEGRSIMIELSADTGIDTAKKLIDIKMQN